MIGNLATLNEPENVDWFKDVPTEISIDLDRIFVFVETSDEMVKITQKIICEQSLVGKGYWFFAYPKKDKKRYKTYIHRDEIFPAMKVDESESWNEVIWSFPRRSVWMKCLLLSDWSGKAESFIGAKSTISWFWMEIIGYWKNLGRPSISIAVFPGTSPLVIKRPGEIFFCKTGGHRKKRQAQMIEML